MLKVARWDVDDTITRDFLSMRITNLSQPNQILPNPFRSDMYAFYNWGMAGGKITKFGTDVMQCVTISNACYLTSYIP
jgi:hypothetical protein